MPGDYPWDADKAFADDDTYPEIILNVDITLAHSVPPKEWLIRFKEAQRLPQNCDTHKHIFESYLKFRGKINRFVRSNTVCRLVDYNIEMADDVREFLIGHCGEEDSKNVEAYENMLTQLPLGRNGRSFVSFVSYLNNDPLPSGFFLAERLDNKSAGLYAAIASRCCPGLSEYLHVKMLKRLQEIGICYLNIGGSEVRSLHDFKCKFAPVEQRYMKLLVYINEPL